MVKVPATATDLTAPAAQDEARLVGDVMTILVVPWNDPMTLLALMELMMN